MGGGGRKWRLMLQAPARSTWRISVRTATTKMRILITCVELSEVHVRRHDTGVHRAHERYREDVSVVGTTIAHD